MRRTKPISVLREVDDWLFLFTGKRLKQLAPRAVQLLGDELVNKLFTSNRGPAINVNDPYTIIGVSPDASDLLVKAHFRDKSFKLHPDTGTEPDAREFQRVVEAYNEIMAKRHGKQGD